MGITEAVMYADGLTKPKRQRRLSPAQCSVSPSEVEALFEMVSAIGTYLRAGCYGSVAYKSRELSKAAKVLRDKIHGATPNIRS